MSQLKYFKAETIRLKNQSDFTERWLQERIEEDPSLLGLGDVVVVQRERKQSSGGRIDFLLDDAEAQTMYEVEIMLGATDESHIIRTIEYWDIERRRFPSREHKAVIVAEELTSRFFNVITLMNRSIPIIAIQLSAKKVEEKIILDFIKVLDIFEEPGDEELLEGDAVDRAYWEKRSNNKALSLCDELIVTAKNYYPNLRITYNRGHIALGTERRNFFWLHPRKRESNIHCDIRVGRDNVAFAKEAFESIGISYNPKREDTLAFNVNDNLYKANKEALDSIINKSFKAYS
ncbi:MAG: hypothetical protein EXS63_09625 [Candidatus Omnitrophica bacterium]|nr:hypothetical protein [Candidatus Omnitrophota bacterium]